ncbi:ribbon-helix-helix domain-containing protein [Rhizobium jaguaris]|uniref:ribbon-helix-helix domain-containing protein n=1 Tax=Rhizobium jaguaris TaxID=1312183 RepID=UPI0039BFB3D4
MMCRMLTTQSRERFIKINRSVRISGHSTSVRLEDAFWRTLEDMAALEGMSTAKLIAELYYEALEQHGSAPNLASVLRTVCLLYREERNMHRDIPRRA